MKHPRMWTLPMDDDQIDELLHSDLLKTESWEELCRMLDGWWEDHDLHPGEGMIVLIRYISVMVMSIGMSHAKQLANEELAGIDKELVWHVQEFIYSALSLKFDENWEFLENEEERIH